MRHGLVYLFLYASAAKVKINGSMEDKKYLEKTALKICRVKSTDTKKHLCMCVFFFIRLKKHLKWQKSKKPKISKRFHPNHDKTLTQKTNAPCFFIYISFCYAKPIPILTSRTEITSCGFREQKEAPFCGKQYDGHRFFKMSLERRSKRVQLKLHVGN